MSGSDSIETTIDATRKILAATKENARVTLEVPANITQGQLSSFEPECELASQAPKLVIDASNVERVDEAGIQLIGQLITTLRGKSIPISFDPPPSDAFLQCADDLGMRADLNLD